VAPGTRPVASSMPPTSVANPKSGPNQRCRLPSTWRKLAFARHPLPTAAVPCRAAGPDGPDRGLGEDPPEGPLRDLDSLALGQQLGQMGVVDPGVRRRGELDDPLAQLVGDAVGRHPLTVAVDQPGRAVDPIPSEQAADLADRQVQDPGRLLGRQSSGQDMVEDRTGGAGLGRPR